MGRLSWQGKVRVVVVQLSGRAPRPARRVSVPFAPVSSEADDYQASLP